MMMSLKRLVCTIFGHKFDTTWCGGSTHPAHELGCYKGCYRCDWTSLKDYQPTCQDISGLLTQPTWRKEDTVTPEPSDWYKQYHKLKISKSQGLARLASMI